MKLTWQVKICEDPPCPQQRQLEACDRQMQGLICGISTHPEELAQLNLSLLKLGVFLLTQLLWQQQDQ